MGAIFLSPLYILLNIYVLWRLLRWMSACSRHFDNRGVWIAVILIYTLLATTVLTGFLITREPLHHWLKMIGNYWLGILGITLLVLLSFDLGRIILNHTLWKENHPSRRRFAIGGAFALALILVVSVYGIVHAWNIKVREDTLSVAKYCEIPELKVALIADLHLGYNVGAPQMRQMVDKINRADVDLVVLAGDIFDNEYEAIKDPDKVAAILGEMESTYGTYACWGNHDVSEKILAGFTFDSGEAQEEDERFLAFLDKARVNLLEDEGVLIDDAFYLFGRKDPSKALKMGENRLPADQVTDGMDKDKPIIVIDHQPLELAELAAAGVDVDLSGHTHNGQIFPGNILLKFLWENPYGIEDKDGMYSCVTSGAGLWGPAMRIGTDCEIMLLDIRFGTENTLAE